MRNRFWALVVVRLVIAVAIVGWAASYLRPGSGEKEFRKTLDAMKQVHTFRVASDKTPAVNIHSDLLWEVDCDRNIVHYQIHAVNTNDGSANELNRDELRVTNEEFIRQDDGSWSAGQRTGLSGTAQSYCATLAQGTDTKLFPPIATMINRGIIQKGDKKTVNGVRCQEYLVTMKDPRHGLLHQTVCIGLEDHLPYETTMDWMNTRDSFSGYNRPIQVDLPQAAVQRASSTTSN